MKMSHNRNIGRKPWSTSAQRLAVELLTSIATPIALSQVIRIRYADWQGLVEASIDPKDYIDAEDFKRDYLAVEAWSKFPSWDLQVDREAVAIKKFFDSEEQCRATNVRLRHFFELDLNNLCSIPSVLHLARRKLEVLLGEFRWSSAERFIDMGPGASFSHPRKRRHAYYKFSGIPETTRECTAAGEALIRSVPGWTFHLSHILWAHSSNDSLVSVVPGNRITTVPKNAKTDRTIAIEPLLNGMLQKGIGGLIRRRLRKVGIDLNDQTRNQKAAFIAASTGTLATIDLSSASDSVSLELVRSLLPQSWVDAIEMVRSPQGVLPSGKIITYQKVSSMGNGFTFELESALFWALSSAVIELSKERDRTCLVYGDDIVVPAGVSNRLIEVLLYCGFSCNAKKTFIDGPFRESCGKHYFMNTDVTPFYFREEVTVAQVILWCNNIRRWSAHPYWGLRGTLYTAYQLAVNKLPAGLQRPRIPDGFGDSALFGDFDEVLPKRARYGLEGFICQVRLPVSEEVEVDGQPMLLATLLRMEIPKTKGKSKDSKVACYQVGRGASAIGTPTGVIPVGHSYKNRKILVPQWVDRGPWLQSRG